MYYLALKTNVYVPHQIINNTSKDGFFPYDIAIERRFLYKSNRSKSKKLRIYLGYNFDINHDDTLRYEIYVNNQIKGKSKSYSYTLHPEYYYFKYRQFNEDTIRLVLSSKMGTDTLTDISFIIYENDSLPWNPKNCFSFDNKTDNIVYVGIAGIRNQSKELVFLRDMAVPPQFENSVYLRPNLISPLLWKDYVEENFDLFYVVVFPNKDELNEWKYNPHHISLYPTYTLSRDELHKQRNTIIYTDTY